MSLYTPVFPLIDPPAEQTPSSSYSSVDVLNQQRGLSYSARLSERHLAIATLPYELCPSSAPLSPGSQERSAKLQTDIEKAVRNGRNITDFCKLRTTKLGCATKQPTHSSWKQGDGTPWILAETEKEWLEWERKMSERRNQRKGKERVNVAPPLTSQSQNTHDKILNWKAGLLSPSSSSVTASNAPSTGTARSSLGFPVVKRSTVAKDAKVKCKPAASLASISRTRHELVPDGQQEPALRHESRVMSTVHVDTSDVERRNSSSDSKQVSLNPPSDLKDQRPTSEEVENTRHEVYDLSAFPPPSFPPDLVTSTQKDASESTSAEGIPRSSHLPNQQEPILEHASNLDPIILANANQESDRPSIFEKHVADDFPTIEPPNREIPQPTPPSPPYSSETSQQPLEMQRSDVHSVADIIRTPATPPQDQARPLTPPPETEKTAPATPSRISNTFQQSPPRTPERRPRRALSEKNLLDVSHAAFLGSSGNVAFANGHITPDAAINGANVPRAAMNLVPRTPDRNRQNLPDPLTTSRKSRPRPRPPSRKHSVQSMDVDIDPGDSAGQSEGGGGSGGAIDPSPAKSERSYFSSPASGSSSGSSGLSRGSMSMLFIPGSPTSPLGFTQNPSRFMPLGHSTQVPSSKNVVAPPRSQREPESDSPTAPRGYLRSQNQSQNNSQKQLAGTQLGTNNSMNYYNSQFDVDMRVDQLSNFMRRDVDLNAWLRSSTDAGTGVETEAEAGNEDDEDEEDVVAVEELTKVHHHHTARSLSS